MRLRVWHQTAYGYDKPVNDSFGAVYLLPRETAEQAVIGSDLVLEPGAGDASTRVDAFGNLASYYQVSEPHSDLVITATSEVQTQSPALAEAEAAQPWEQLNPMVSADPWAWAATEFALASPLVEQTIAVREYTAQSLAPGRPVVEAVDDLVDRIYGDFRYDPTATTVTSTITDVLSKRAGVCQDFAHVAIAGLRSHGLAARYVSGYIATEPPPGKERIFGADASHAWLAVWLGGQTWLAVDPTNNQRVNDRYVTVGWGRDYGDVPPVKGVIFTEATKSTLKVSVDVSMLTEAEPGNNLE